MGLRRYRLDSLPSPGTAGAEEEGEWVVFLGDQFPLAQEDDGQPPAGQPAVQLDAEVRTIVSGGWRGWVRHHMQSGDASDSAASGEPEPRALSVYRRLPADEGPRVRSMVAVVARLRVGRGRAVQLVVAHRLFVLLMVSHFSALVVDYHDDIHHVGTILALNF